MNTSSVRKRELSTLHQFDDLSEPKGEDYQASRVELEILISRSRSEGDSLIMGYLLQSLGDLEARSGNVKMAHSLHQEAVELDSHTPLPYLLYATGLFRAFDRADLAMNQIRDLKVLLLSGEWEPTVNEPSQHWYMDELNALSEEIKMSMIRG